MGFVDAVKSFFRRYVDFQGRSSRSEFWWAYLFVVLAVLVLEGLMFSDMGGTLGTLAGGLLGIFALATLIPSVAVTVRRLHDTDKSGWFILLGLIPLIGAIVLIVFYATRGTPGPNKFGPDPLGSQQAEVFA